MIQRTAGCGTCLFFFHPNPHQEAGLCRRYPPTVLLVGIQPGPDNQPAALTQSGYPPMMPGGWCGEHQGGSAQLDS